MGIHPGKQVDRSSSQSQLCHRNFSVHDHKLSEEGIDERLADLSAGNSIAQEVIDPIGTQAWKWLLQERIDRIIFKVGRYKAEVRKGVHKVWPVKEFRFQVLVMILLFGCDQKINRMGKSGVGNVV